METLTAHRNLNHKCVLTLKNHVAHAIEHRNWIAQFVLTLKIDSTSHFNVTTRAGHRNLSHTYRFNNEN